MIAAGDCPVGSTGGSVLNYGSFNGSTASAACLSVLALTGTAGGSASFCSTSGCNSPAAKMSSPAARPAVASLLAFGAAAFAALLL